MRALFPIRASSLANHWRYGARWPPRVLMWQVRIQALFDFSDHLLEKQSRSQPRAPRQFVALNRPMARGDLSSPQRPLDRVDRGCRALGGDDVGEMAQVLHLDVHCQVGPGVCAFEVTISTRSAAAALLAAINVHPFYRPHP